MGLRLEVYRRLNILAGTLLTLLRDYHARTSPTRFNEAPDVVAVHPRAIARIRG